MDWTANAFEYIAVSWVHKRSILRCAKSAYHQKGRNKLSWLYPFLFPSSPRVKCRKSPFPPFSPHAVYYQPSFSSVDRRERERDERSPIRFLEGQERLKALFIPSPQPFWQIDLFSESSLLWQQDSFNDLFRCEANPFGMTPIPSFFVARINTFFYCSRLQIGLKCRHYIDSSLIIAASWLLRICMVHLFPHLVC